MRPVPDRGGLHSSELNPSSKIWAVRDITKNASGDDSAKEKAPFFPAHVRMVQSIVLFRTSKSDDIFVYLFFVFVCEIVTVVDLCYLFGPRCIVRVR